MFNFAILNAALHRMEGYQITDDIKKNCECLIKGEITISQLVEEIKNK